MICSTEHGVFLHSLVCCHIFDLLWTMSLWMLVLDLNLRSACCSYAWISRRCSRLLCRGKPRSCLKLPKQISHHNISVANGTVPDKPLFRMSVARTTSNSRYNFALTSGNEDGLFKVRTSSSYKRPSGIVYTAKELVGPKEYVIDLTLYLLRGRRKTSYISRLYVFVAEYDL